jgi:transcriptional regulator with XRE-family HTH domain
LFHPREFGNFIRHRRLILGKTQQHLADAAHCSQPWVLMIEAGGFRRPLRPDLLLSLARALDVPVGELMQRCGYPREMTASSPISRAS